MEKTGEIKFKYVIEDGEQKCRVESLTSSEAMHISGVFALLMTASSEAANTSAIAHAAQHPLSCDCESSQMAKKFLEFKEIMDNIFYKKRYEEN